jgi:hypothetical protein
MTTQIRKEQLEFSQSDGAIKIPVTTQDKDFEVTVNDGGTTRTAIQVHGDEGSVSFPRQSYVYINMANNQSIAKNTATLVGFDTVIVDTLGEFSTANKRFTAKTSGVYQINASIGYSAFPNSGGRACIIQIRRDNVTLTYNRQYSTSLSQDIEVTSSIILYLAKDQYIDIWTVQSTDASQTCRLANSTTYLTITKVS